MATPAAARLPIQTRSEAGSLVADCDRSRAASQMNNASAPNQTKVARAQAIASFLSTLSPSLDGNRTLPRPAGSGGDSSAAERSEPPSNVQLSAVGEVRLSPPDLQWRHLARTASAPKSTACKILGSPARLQQFFLSYGQAWRSKSREPALRQQIITDEHAPAQYRTDTVRNLDAWYPAFDVKAGQALYLAPKDRVSVW
jgi:Peptidase family M13